MRLVGVLLLPLGKCMTTMGWSTSGISVSNSSSGGGGVRLGTPSLTHGAAVAVAVVVVVVIMVSPHRSRSRAKMAAHVSREMAGAQKSANKVHKASAAACSSSSWSFSQSKALWPVVVVVNGGRMPCLCKVAQTDDSVVVFDVGLDNGSYCLGGGGGDG
jgi:hypothetical protein